jgi:hypothetical protein
MMIVRAGATGTEQKRRLGRTVMAENRLLRSIALTGWLIASMTLMGCDDTRRTARASTSVAEAEVSTELPPSQVSDEFLQATATVAAEAASVPHPVAAAVVVPPEPLPPPQDNASTNPPAPASDNVSNAAANAQ